MMDDNRTKLVRAVVFDWAGTIFDFGSHAPMGAFVKLFEQEGIRISIDDARGPMGMPKWDHIHTIGQLQHIQEQWLAKFGRPFSERDTDRLYDIFTPMNAASVVEHAALIPGFLELASDLRAKGIKIGTTTGYNRQIMDVVLPLVKAQGFIPDNLVCADDLPTSRPTPMGMYKCFLDLDVWPSRSVVKVDDTVPGLLEGYHSDCWTVGVVASGNEAGLTYSQWIHLSEAEKANLRKRVATRLAAGHPDFLIDTVADLPQTLQKIQQLLDQGA